MWIKSVECFDTIMDVEVTVEDIMSQASKEELIELFWAIHAEHESTLEVALKETYEEVPL